MDSCYTITRYYGNNEKDLERLWCFIEQATTYSTRILIGINTEKDFTDCARKYSQRQQQSSAPVDFISIQPWVGISSPLNILLNYIPSNEQHVLIQSVEVQCTSSHVNRLRSYLQQDDILCAGVVLDGHQVFDNKFNMKYVPLQGDTSPWNTFIMWNLEKLRRTGFPTCSDFVSPPGMEDSAAIALQQKLFGGMKKNRALLVHFSGDVGWLTKFEHDQERLLKHQIKMKSKNGRTKQLIEMLDITESDQEVFIGVEYIHDKQCS